MQYGNFFSQASTVKKLRRLNRTMQYGNEDDYYDSEVVYSEFKSYYVVWKLDDSEIPREDNEGLNRTMQYGNWKYKMKTNIVSGV